MSERLTITEHIRRWELPAAIVFLVLAALLRFVVLGDAPNGLFRDEWEKGYTALQLSQTGRYGILGAEGVRVSNPAPLFIEVFAGHDRTSAIYQWLSAPVVGMAGLTAWSTRLVAAVAGWLTILFGWRLARRLFGVGGGLFALALLAVQPTLLIFSLWAQQGVVSVMFAALGFWLAARLPAQAEGSTARRLHALAMALTLLLSAYAYDPARLVIPAVLAAWLLLHGRLLDRRSLGMLLVPFALGWIALVLFTLGAGSARLGRVLVTEDGGMMQPILNYFSHFSPRFLFLSGDANGRHSLPGAGVLGYTEGLFVLLAVLMLFRCSDAGLRRAMLLSTAMLLAAPLAAALTRDGIPHALRSNMLMLAGPLVAAACATAVARKGQSWKLAVIVTLLLGHGVDSGKAVAGLSRLREPSPNWESGTIELLRAALRDPGPVAVSGNIAYAPYAMLFAEQTPAAAFHEQGLGALRSRLLPAGDPPRLAPGTSLLSPPMPPMPLEWTMIPVVLYRPEGVYTWSADRETMVALPE